MKNGLNMFVKSWPTLLEDIEDFSKIKSWCLKTKLLDKSSQNVDRYYGLFWLSNFSKLLRKETVEPNLKKKGKISSISGAISRYRPFRTGPPFRTPLIPHDSAGWYSTEPPVIASHR